MTTKAIARSILGGALGAVTPYVLFALFGNVILNPLVGAEEANGIGEGMGILMTLACLPTILIGAVVGGLSVWLVLKLEKPRSIFMRMEQPQGTRWMFNTAFAVGFITGPILGMSLFAISLISF